MAEDNKAVVMRALMGFASADDEAVLRELSPSIRWHVSGRNPMAGVHEGPDSVVRVHKLIRETCGGQPQIIPHDILASDDHVVVLAGVEATRGDTVYKGNLGYIMHVIDGKVAEGWIFQEDQHAWDAFCAP